MSAVIIPKDVPVVVDHIVGDAVPLIIRARMTAPTAACPQCHQPSARVHSRYWRSPQDLPWHRVAVRWQLACRKFGGNTPGCPQKIFRERLSTDWLGVNQQRTQGVWDTLTA